MFASKIYERKCNLLTKLFTEKSNTKVKTCCTKIKLTLYLVNIHNYN